MALREMKLLRKVMWVMWSKGYNLITHYLITCGKAAYKKDSPRGKSHKGVLSIKHLPDSPMGIQRECYHIYSDTDSPHGECYLAYGHRYHGSFSMASHLRVVSGSY